MKLYTPHEVKGMPKVGKMSTSMKPFHVPHMRNVKVSVKMPKISKAKIKI